MKQKDVKGAPPRTLVGHEEQLMADVGKEGKCTKGLFTTITCGT
jgi:hypothetical protein